MNRLVGVQLHILVKLHSSGAQVFVFFEAGDVNKPVYFAAAQSGPGWLTQHINQHVFKSDNVTVCIDQAPTNKQSTCQYHPYIGTQSTVINNDFNKKYESIFNNFNDIAKNKIPTRLDIKIAASQYTAINLQISGNVNMQVFGDMFQEHYGDRFQTHYGNLYRYHEGKVYIQHDGDTEIKTTGNTVRNYNGSINDHIQNNVKTIIERNI